MTHLEGLHLQPWKNWCNDPNGLYFDGELYHAFYQHYPYAHQWGPMHWGHATSHDLYRWTHKPIAIFPDAKGQAFSGSALIDEANCSGLGTPGNPPVLLYYTQHVPEDAPGGRSEHQSIAYSTDGVHFFPYEHNPIIDGTGRPDFRDPSIYVEGEGEARRFIMSLACGDHIEFYHSRDLIHWELAGFFRSEHPTAQGLWECPALVPLQDGEDEIFMLIVSYGLGDDEGRAVSKYFLGELRDGVFVANSDEAFLLDEGPDFYAVVPFHNTQKPTLLAWALNWGYADQTPTQGYCGQFSSPRGVELIRGRDGRRRVATPLLEPPADAFEEAQIAPEGSAILASERGFLLDLPGDASWELQLRNSAGERVRIALGEDRTLKVDRSHSGFLDAPLLRDSRYQTYEIPAVTEAPGNVRIFLDGPLLEVFADGGSRCCTMVVYPETPYTEVQITGAEGSLRAIRAYEQPLCEEPFANAKHYETETESEG